MRVIRLDDNPVRKYSSLDQDLEYFHGYQREFDDEFYAESNHSLLDGDIELEREGSKYPGISCITPGNPYVLHCFPPFKTELTKKQHLHLDIIAKKIRRSFTTARPMTKVRIMGHSSTWHKTSPKELELRSFQRSGNAGEQLILRLLPKGYAKRVDIKTDGRSDAVDWQGKRYSSRSGSQKARSDRALNRRVEIRLIQSKKKKPKGKVPCELGEAIKNINFVRAPWDRRLKCIQNILILGVCKKPVDDRFWTFEGSDLDNTKIGCIFRRQPSAHEGSKFIA